MNISPLTTLQSSHITRSQQLTFTTHISDNQHHKYLAELNDQSRT